MINIINFGEFKTELISQNKKQIILTHSGRYSNEYLLSLKHRHNGKYNKIPNYFISRNGKVLRLLDDENCGNFFYKNEINKNSIVVCLENLGWLEKMSFNKGYNNWLGYIYNSDIFEKKWRDRFYWHPYTKEQVVLSSKLCVEIAKKTSIKLNMLGHNTKINGVEKFEGIVTRSNFMSEVTDLSPAFDFELFEKYLKDE